MVRPELAGHGLGRLLMEKLIQYARSRGIKELRGDVLSENTVMLQLCKDLGFAIQVSRLSPEFSKTLLILE